MGRNLENVKIKADPDESFDEKKNIQWGICY